LKRIFLTSFLILGILLSVCYVVFSYIFIDPSLLIMLGQSKPIIFELVAGLRGNVSLVLTNQVGLLIVILLCALSVIIVFTKKEISNRMLFLAVLIPSLLVFAYPMVSRDIFSYLYYAKMILVEHQNPYLVAPAVNWGIDMWVGFLHNTERVYVYGPIALLANLIPMAIIGAERFVANVLILKAVCLAFFLVGAWLFLKITKNRNVVAVLWILNPYIINELLINGHNDLMMIVLFWLAIYLKQKSKTMLAILAFALSVATKFVSVVLLPIFFLPKKLQTVLALFSIVVICSYFIYNGNLPWYYSWIYFCLPYLKLNKAQILSILFLQLSLTLAYAGFLQYGLWGTYPSSQIMVAIIRSTKLFIPLFVLATVYPFFLEKFNSRRFS
jgi:hypothetical protein